MLAHLKTEYEANRSKLSAPWNPDNPIEDIFLSIHDAKRIALCVNEPITDGAAICLTLLAFEATGVHELAIDKRQQKDEATKTMPNFCLHFQAENEAHLTIMTGRTAGYHGAHAANNIPAVTPMPTVPAAPITNTANVTTASAPHVCTNHGVNMYYCWSHGLGKNPEHTSHNCHHPQERQQAAATADNLFGGNNTILGGQAQRANTGS